MAEDNTTKTDAAKKLADIKEHNRIASLVWNKDFKPLTKDQNVPSDVKSGGPLLAHPENKELTLQLDLLAIQRGDCKGMLYPGLHVTKDNFEQFLEFYGVDYVASRIDTVFNTENQRYALGTDQVKAITPQSELYDALASRTVRGESVNSLKNDLAKYGAEFQALMAKGDIQGATEVSKLLTETIAKMQAKG